MKIKKEDIPAVMEAPGTVIRTLKGLDGFTVAYNDVPKGLDFTPFLKGLENDMCHCPHLGYVFEGTIRVIYNDGSEELITAGDVFHLPAGHTAIVEEDLKFLEFNPSKEYDEVLENIGKRMAELDG